MSNALTIEKLRDVAAQLKTLPHGPVMFVQLSFGTDGHGPTDQLLAIGAVRSEQPHGTALLIHAQLDVDGVRFEAQYTRPMSLEDFMRLRERDASLS